MDRKESPGDAGRTGSSSRFFVPTAKISGGRGRHDVRRARTRRSRRWHAKRSTLFYVASVTLALVLSLSLSTVPAAAFQFADVTTTSTLATSTRTSPPSSTSSSSTSSSLPLSFLGAGSKVSSCGSRRLQREQSIGLSASSSSTEATTSTAKNGTSGQLMTANGEGLTATLSNGADPNGIESEGSIDTNNDNIDDDNNITAAERLLSSFPPPYSSSSSSPFPPGAVQQLRDQKEASSKRVAKLEVELAELEGELRNKTKMLQRERDERFVENANLVTQFVTYTQKIQNQMRNRDAVVAAKAASEASANLAGRDGEEKSRLQGQVRKLQEDLVKTQNELRRELKTSEQLRERLDEVEDTVEFEQMEFEKEKRQMQLALDEERKRISDIQSKFEADRRNFEKEKLVLEQELIEREGLLLQSQKQWSVNQAQFETTQRQLEEDLERQKTRFDATSAELNQIKGDYEDERGQLQNALQQDGVRLRELESTINFERKRFENAQREVQSQIDRDRRLIDNLYKKIEVEEDNFERERVNLQVAIDLEQERVVQLQRQLAKEKIEYQGELKDLQERIREEQRVARLKKKQMHDRYQLIRKELTGLWEGAKRDARDQKRVLVEKYEGRLSEMSRGMEQLESTLDNARAAVEELQGLLSSVERQKAMAEKQTELVEQRYISMVAVRNREIVDLRVSLNTVKGKLREREDLIRRYESSYREVFKLGVRVTEKKLQRGRTRIREWIRDSGKNGK